MAGVVVIEWRSSLVRTRTEEATAQARPGQSADGRTRTPFAHHPETRGHHPWRTHCPGRAALPERLHHSRPFAPYRAIHPGHPTRRTRSGIGLGFVERNVATLASPPRQKPRQIETLSADDAYLLMKHTRDDRLGNLLATALYTGMRQGEVLGPRWPDVDLDAGTPRVRQAVQKIDGARQFLEPKSAKGKRPVPSANPREMCQVGRTNWCAGCARMRTWPGKSTDSSSLRRWARRSIRATSPTICNAALRWRSSPA